MKQFEVMKFDANEEDKKIREWCRKENIDPDSLQGKAAGRGWIQGQISLIDMIKPEFKRLQEIERRHRWIEEHLDNFDQLNIPEKP